MGVQIAKEASIKTNDVAGDGTTTAMVLAQSMIREGVKTLQQVEIQWQLKEVWTKQ